MHHDVDLNIMGLALTSRLLHSNLSDSNSQLGKLLNYDCSHAANNLQHTFCTALGPQTKPTSS